jgi:phosphate transport system ATP-binding protein
MGDRAREPIVVLENLAVSFSGHVAIKPVSFSVYSGEVLALMGPSGCGKSTVLRAINRMNEVIPGCQTSGCVYYRGENIYGSGINPFNLRGEIGMVFQRPNPFPFSIYDNVTYGLRVQGENRKDVLHETAEFSLKRAGLWEEVRDDLNRSALRLSGGQQQRLCIARALCADPKILLLDEPCSALDPIATGRIEDTIADLQRENRVAIVMVTHNREQAARASQRTGFMWFDGEEGQGYLHSLKDTRNLFENPESGIEGDFIRGRFG